MKRKLNFQTKLFKINIVFSAIGAVSCGVAMVINPMCIKRLGFAVIAFMWYGIISYNFLIRCKIKKQREEIKDMVEGFDFSKDKQ